MKVRFLISAKQDMQTIKTYIAKDSPQTAIKFRKSTGRLKEFPRSGRVIPELQNPDLREILVDGYRVMYQLDGTNVNVFAVHESRRQYPPLED